jgi:pyruvate,water dikinase
LLNGHARSRIIIQNSPVNISRWTSSGAKDGITGELFILQARPETVHAQKADDNFIETYELTGGHGAPLTSGVAVGQKVGHGKAHVMLDASKLTSFKEGEILVTTMTDPAWEPIMKRASAIVTERGGRTCHSAIISRELGIPCIVGTGDATEKVKNGTDVTVSCAEGDVGNIYYGKVDFNVKNTRSPTTSGRGRR